MYMGPESSWPRNIPVICNYDYEDFVLLGSCKIWVREECELLVRLKPVEQDVMKR